MVSPKVVLVGSAADAQIAALRDRLRSGGHDPLIFDSADFPQKSRLSMRSDLASICVDGDAIVPASVYVRGLYSDPESRGERGAAQMNRNWRRALAAAHERSALLSAALLRWEELGVPMYNPIARNHRLCKPYQLALLQAAGLPVPDTLWSNDPEAVRSFQAGRRIAYKPVAGGAATRELTAEDLSEQRLAALAAAPVTFQELLPGEDIRVYVIDGRISSAIRIETDAIDFRQNERSLARIELPAEVAAQCIAATRLLGLRYTGMDLKRDARGVLRILELNSAPMFVGFDALAGTDVAGDVATALLAGLRR